MNCFMCKLILVVLLYVDSAKAACSNDCLSCSDSTCTHCESSFYLAGGNCHSCPVNCPTCVHFNNCSSCEPTYYGLTSRCQTPCSSHCLNEHCDDKTGNCIECKNGVYGLMCQRDCTLCENEQCDLRSCTLGCKSGYYAFNDGTETYCQSCPNDCRKCERGYACDICNDGYYQYKYTSNDRLFVHCIHCTGFPTPCPNSCAIENCNNCQVLNDNLFCTECINGYRFNGEICVLNSNNCSQGCSTDCNEEGDCLGSCNDGWTGEKCFDRCEDSCAKCRKDDRAFCEQCNGDFYSTACSLPCPNHCRIMAGVQTCNIDDGYCLNGCDRGFWGDLCTEACSTGCFDHETSQLCNRNNGACMDGCKGGYSGDTCDIELTLGSTTSESKEGVNVSSKRAIDTTTDTYLSTTQMQQYRCESKKCKYNMFVVGYASGFGTALFVVAITSMIWFIRRWYMAKNSNKETPNTTDMSTYYNVRSGQGADTRTDETDTERNNYEHLNERDRGADMTYSQLQRNV